MQPTVQTSRKGNQAGVCAAAMTLPAGPCQTFFFVFKLQYTTAMRASNNIIHQQASTPGCPPPLGPPPRYRSAAAAAAAAPMAGCRKASEMRMASSLRMVRLPWSKQVLRYLRSGGEGARMKKLGSPGGKQRPAAPSAGAIHMGHENQQQPCIPIRTTIQP